MGQKALITGASGFIGSTLASHLTREGVEPRVLLRSSSSVQGLEGLSYERVEGDLSDEESLRRAVSGVDVIYHLAGRVVAPSRDAFFEANARGTERLARAALAAAPGLRRLVYVSSLAAGGPAPKLSEPVDETCPAHPVSDYGASKWEGERLLSPFFDRLPVAIVRPPIVYGPRDRALLLLAQTLKKGWMPVVRGGAPRGQKYYSAIHVDDLCRGLIAVGQSPLDRVPSGSVFYLSGEGTFAYTELLGDMAQALGVRPRKLMIPFGAAWVLGQAAGAWSKISGGSYSLNPDKLREIRADYWICSNEKAKREVGFSPRYDLKTGMKDAIEGYRRAGWI